MNAVVDQLKFKTQRRAGFAFGNGHKIFYAAVSALSQFEIEGQIESAVLIFCDYIAAAGMGFAFGSANDELAILNAPSFARETSGISRFPAVGRLSIEQKFITIRLFI